MIELLLANSAPESEGYALLKLILPWITTFVVAVIGAVLSRHFRQVGRREGKASANVTIEGQPIAVRGVPEFITRAEFDEVKRDLDEIKGALAVERGVARTANGNLHKRIDDVATASSEMKGQLGQMSANIQQLLQLAIHKAPPRSRG